MSYYLYLCKRQTKHYNKTLQKDLMSYQFTTDFDCAKGDIGDIYAELQKPYTSPTLEEHKKEVKVHAVKRALSLDDLDNEREPNDDDYESLSDERIDEELEELTDEDYEDFAGIILAGIDWGFEKILNNMLNRKQVEETAAQKVKLRRLKILMKKVMIKHGVKFKIELLFGIMFVGYFADRYSSAEKIDPDKGKGKKDKKPKPEKPKMTVVKNKKKETVEDAEIIDTPEVFEMDATNGKFSLDDIDDDEDDSELSAENLLDNG